MNDVTLAAMCLWEEVLRDWGAGWSDYPVLGNIADVEGACALRGKVAGLAEDCNMAWRMAREQYGYDSPFDWEFVPAFLVHGTTAGEARGPLTLKGAWWEIAKQATTKGAWREIAKQAAERGE